MHGQQKGDATLKKELSPILDDAGLNLSAVFNIQDLPVDVKSPILDVYANTYQQLIVFAHAGKKMWHALQDSPFQSVANPIDSFSCHAVQQYFERELPGASYEVIYPNEHQIIPLQKLGTLAGWHHDSPFRIGINQEYGSWFAYRVVALANTSLNPTQPMTSPSPCVSCIDKPCIKDCPADALTCSNLSLQTCINYRLEANSQCQYTCLSRITCPIAQEHRYSKEQIKYHFTVSLNTISELSSTIG